MSEDDFTESYESSDTESFEDTTEILNKLEEDKAEAKRLIDLAKKYMNKFAKDNDEVHIEKLMSIAKKAPPDVRKKIDSLVLSEVPKGDNSNNPLFMFSEDNSKTDYCHPRRLKGYKLSNTPECGNPVYEIKKGNIELLNDCKGKTVYIFAASMKHVTEKHLNVVKKTNNPHQIHIVTEEATRVIVCKPKKNNEGCILSFAIIFVLLIILIATALYLRYKSIQ